jgi:FAD/FMN-containing dehydrogenase
VNYQLSKAVQHAGLHFAPDPSSQGACTIGGNVAENSGGPHTLKYGVTVNHITGLQVVLPDGEIMELGGEEDEPFGYDLVGLLTGSEGTLAIVTEVVARLASNPQATRTLLAVFETLEDASQTVSDIIAAGIVPAALELMDALTLQAVEAAFGYGFPLDAEAVLLIELDGLEAELDGEQARCWTSASAIAPARCAARPPRWNARNCGQPAKKPLARWAGSRPHASPKMASFRARNCPKCCARRGASPKNTACASRMCSTRATATCTPCCCSMTPTLNRWRGW